MSLFSVKLNISFILIISFPFLCKNCPIIFKAALCGFLATRGQNNSKAEKHNAASFFPSFCPLFVPFFLNYNYLSFCLCPSFFLLYIYPTFCLLPSFPTSFLPSFIVFISFLLLAFLCSFLTSILPSFLFLLPFTLIFLFIGFPSPFLVSYIVFYVMHVCLHL